MWPSKHYQMPRAVAGTDGLRLLCRHITAAAFWLVRAPGLGVIVPLDTQFAGLGRCPRVHRVEERASVTKPAQRSSELWDVYEDARGIQVLLLFLFLTTPVLGVEAVHVVSLIKSQLAPLAFFFLIAAPLMLCGLGGERAPSCGTDPYLCTRRAQHRYHRFMEQLAEKTQNVYQKGDRKNSFRGIEKIGLAHRGDGWAWNASGLKDVIRGAQIMPDVAKGLQLLKLLVACDRREAEAAAARGMPGWNARECGITDEIVIVGVKNRWTRPTSGGWSDALLTFYFADDPSRHIWETQLVHGDMMNVRKRMGAHTGYTTFRCALELLEATGHADLVAEFEEEATVVRTAPGVGAQLGAVAHAALLADVASLKTKVAGLQASNSELQDSNLRLHQTVSYLASQMADITSRLNGAGIAQTTNPPSTAPPAPTATDVDTEVHSHQQGQRQGRG